MKIVILAAGLGSRLWPLSTAEKPKQFQPLIFGESLLQYTYRQLNKITPKQELYVQTLKGLEAHVYEQLPDIDKDHVILVPKRRDTLAETLWALSLLSETNQPILFKSVDQYTTNAKAFLTALAKSLKQYDHDRPAITLFGTKYQSYSANSGYLTADDTRTITSFVEKPTKKAIEKLLQKNSVYRSLFLFIANRESVLTTLEALDVDWAKRSKHLLQVKPAERQRAFLAMPTIDISSTLFQSSYDLKLAPISYNDNFLDVGRYSALRDLNDKDANGNVILGKVTLGENCHNNFIVNQTDSTLVVLSVHDSVIIQSTAGNLVSNIDAANKIGEIYKAQLHGG